MRTDGGQESRPDTGHPVQPIERPERPPRFAIGDDGLGKRRAHAREAGELAGGGPVNVYPLIGTQGTGEGEHAVPVRQRRLGGKGGEKLDLTGRLAGLGGPPAHTLAGEPEGQQKQEGAALGG